MYLRTYKKVSDNIFAGKKKSLVFYISETIEGCTYTYMHIPGLMNLPPLNDSLTGFCLPNGDGKFT